MRSAAPPLMPVFRSGVQARVLTRLLLHPEEEWTPTALAGVIDAPLSTVHAELRRLLDAEILVERTVGRSRLVRANPANPSVRPLTELVTLTFGPSTVVAEEFSGVPGVRRVLLFGSWAARYLGQPGHPPRDVDVLVEGRPDRAAVYEAADRAERRIGFPVRPVVVTPERLDAAADPLTRQIAAAPSLVVLDDAAGA